MIAPTTFSLSRAYETLGIRSRLMPEYRVTPMQPVVLAADVSNTFAPEAIEGRRIWAQALGHGGGVSPSGDSTICLEVMARAAGGLVIEHLEMLDDNANANLYAFRSATTWAPAGWVNILGMELGGVPTNSLLYTQDNLDPLPVTQLYWGDPYFLMPGARTFIPAGEYLRLQSVILGGGAHILKVMIVAREIPEALGAA